MVVGGALVIALGGALIAWRQPSDARTPRSRGSSACTSAGAAPATERSCSSCPA
jgi:hypothetical protein